MKKTIVTVHFDYRTDVIRLTERLQAQIYYRMPSAATSPAPTPESLLLEEENPVIFPAWQSAVHSTGTLLSAWSSSFIFTDTGEGATLRLLLPESRIHMADRLLHLCRRLTESYLIEELALPLSPTLLASYDSVPIIDRLLAMLL